MTEQRTTIELLDNPDAALKELAADRAALMAVYATAAKNRKSEVQSNRISVVVADEQAIAEARAKYEGNWAVFLEAIRRREGRESAELARSNLAVAKTIKTLTIVLAVATGVQALAAVYGAIRETPTYEPGPSRAEGTKP
jgi:hypothetical protein